MSVYPLNIDSDIEISRVDDNITEVGSDVINALRDAVFAIENTLGVNPQGNMQDLVARVNKVIDEDGNIKTSSISAHGLVTLPITNIHIGSSAAIEEDKLDLDYPTATLNALVSSTRSDINAISTSLTNISILNTRHFNGITNRHDGYQIDLLADVMGVDKVEPALHNLDNALTDHKNLSSGVHAASSVSVNDEFVNISASDVQSALVKLDNIGLGGIQTHQDILHENAISLSNRGEQGKQGNLKETTLAGTIYQTDHAKATDIFQIMRPNASRVTGKNHDLKALSIVTAKTLRIQAGGIERSTLDVNLSSVIPTDDIDQIISAVNVVAREEHYPISAYNTGGKLTISHNIPGNEFTIQILNTVSLSASSALGFGDVTSTEFRWSDNYHSCYIGGKRVTGIKSFINTYHTHSTSPLSTIVLGLGDLTQYGLTTSSEGRVLCHITNHSTSPSSNGTYYITSFPNSATFILNKDIPLGSFNIEIAADSINFTNSANGELFDIFIEAGTDGYSTITKSNRVSYGPISGISLRSISENFPTSDVAWKVDSSNSVQLFKGDESGIITSIPTGFQGQVKVFMPDNVNSALFEVTGVPPNGKKSMTVSAFAGTDDKLYIGTVHYAGNFGLYTLKFVTDRRRLGGSVENKTEDELVRTTIEDVTKELRNNGVIMGLDVISSDSTSFKLRGGRALVDGRFVDVETQNITVNEYGASQRLLLLDRDGNFIIRSEFDSGYSFETLTDGDEHGDERGVAIICEFETDGSSIVDGYFQDRRLLVSNIDKRLVNTEAALNQQITQIRSTTKGSSWGFTVAESSIIDGYLGSIEVGQNHGFSYIPSQYETPTSVYGFLAGNATITTRVFQFSDTDTMITSVFRAIGMTHINVFVEMTYSGTGGGPFGVSGTTHIEVGIGTETGMTSLNIGADYARVKTINTGVLPVNSQTERYIASIPVNQIPLAENIMFDMVPRIRIVNSHYVDGGTSADQEPTITFNNIRIVTSSYSIAGDIDDVDGSSSSIGVTVGEIL
ncbi:hypothetical protein LCGC14_1534240 [marine sediment metagenome]|uniref:Uncharacterized protein n=1 Tax=marine sediment metagenome TaxID=412755 RepID=A0A0F9JFU3_9ZZZZ